MSRETFLRDTCALVIQSGFTNADGVKDRSYDGLAKDFVRLADFALAEQSTRGSSYALIELGLRG